ncbi:MAG: hypothetical protein ACE5I4_01715 [Thermoplasmata archaeon]
MVTFVEVFFQSVAAALAVFGASITYLTYKRGAEIRKLNDEIYHLKRVNLEISGKVNPESDRKLVEGAEKSIQILGINALGALHHAREELIEFLKRKKGTLRVLLLDPKGREFGSRAEFEKDVVGRIKSEWEASVRILRGIAYHARGSGNIELRLYDEKPDRSLIIVDASEEEPYKARMLINYYPPTEGKRGYEGGQFLSERSLARDRDAFDTNWDRFRTLWEESTAAEFGTSGSS